MKTVIMCDKVSKCRSMSPSIQICKKTAKDSLEAGNYMSRASTENTSFKLTNVTVVRLLLNINSVCRGIIYVPVEISYSE